MDQKGVQPVRADPGQNQQQYNNQGQATAAPPAGMSPTYQSQQGAQASSLSLAQVPGQAMGAYPAPLSYQYLQQQQQEQLQAFWMGQRQEIEQVMDFKTHQLPLARIKKIMKADEDVRMIAAEAPVLFAKACEMFILELTLRAWIHTEENKRRTLQKNDIAAAITRTDIFDFLVDIVPRDELKEEGIGFPHPALPVGAPAEPIPYGGVYYMPQQSQVLGGQMPQPQQGGMVPPGVVMGRPAMPMDPALYAQQPRGSFSAYMSPQPGQQPVWQQQQMPPNNNSSGPTSSS